MAKLQLNAGEEIVEAFGVSPRYTIALIGVGAVCLLVALATFAIGSLSAPTTAPEAPQAALSLASSLVSFLFLGLGLYLVGMAVYLQVAYRYYLTNQRVIVFQGLTSQHMVASQYEEIQTVFYRRDLLANLFGAGTVEVKSNDSIALVGIPNPEQYVDEISRLQEVHSTAENKEVDPGQALEVVREARRAHQNDPTASQSRSQQAGPPSNDLAGKIPPEAGMEGEATPPSLIAKLVERVRESLLPAVRQNGATKASPPTPARAGKPAPSVAESSMPTSTTVTLDAQILPGESRPPERIRTERSRASAKVRSAQKSASHPKAEK